MAEWNALWDCIERDAENAYQRGMASDPERARLLDMQGTSASLKSFREAVKTQILGAERQGAGSP